MRQALVGKSGKSKTRIEANLQIDGNPRGGVLLCERLESIAWNSWDKQDVSYIIVASIVTFVLLVVVVISCYYFFKAKPGKVDDPNYEAIDPNT